MLVYWYRVPSIHQNGIIISYEVRYEPLETFGGHIQTQTRNVSGTATGLFLTGLQEYVGYNISVRAYTSAGEGPYSTEETGFTREYCK